MIKVPYLIVLLKLDTSTTNVFTVPPHELALMTVRYGQGSVKVQRKAKINVKVDPLEEYKRLERVWGSDPETKQTWVKSAFGHFEEGRFTKTMKEGAKHYIKKKKKKKVELTPQQKAANTRAANRAAKLAEEQNAKDAESTQEAA